MKINKYWKLDSDLFPYRVRDIGYRGKATQKQFDSVTIIHYQDIDFRPIVLCEDYVRSSHRYDIKEFYKGVVFLLGKDLWYGYYCDYISIYDWGLDKYDWGCRVFTRNQLLLIKRTMEWHYGKEYFK